MRAQALGALASSVVVTLLHTQYGFPLKVMMGGLILSSPIKGASLPCCLWHEQDAYAAIFFGYGGVGVVNTLLYLTLSKARKATLLAPTIRLFRPHVRAQAVEPPIHKTGGAQSSTAAAVKISDAVPNRGESGGILREITAASLNTRGALCPALRVCPPARFCRVVQRVLLPPQAGVGVYG